MTTFCHECPGCNGEGTVDEIDHERTFSYSEEPTWKTSVCDVCHGDGEVQLDQQAHAFVCAMADEYMAQRVTDRAIREEQRQHIATLEALLRAERDRCASLEQHIHATHGADA